ncbi:MAG TPA: hypothetical protein VIM59_01420 [Cellvibrio sp.]
MRNFVVALRFIVLLFGLNLLAISAPFAEESEMDMDLMQTIEDTNDSLTSNVSLEDADAATADAQTLNELFAVVVEHYQKDLAAGNDVAEAVKLSEKSKKLSGDIISQVKAGDFESAAHSATELSRTCKTCHNFYKED